MYANYHTHTFRCGHATGTEEEYIKTAIDGGIKIMGFSDHVPYLFPDGHQANWKMQVKDAEDYISTVNALKEKYRDKIKIYVGFEMEYYPEHFEGMLAYVKKLGAEYLILGQHYIGNENDGRPHSAFANHNESDLIEYTDNVIAGMKTGKFLYVAHPDVLRFYGDEKIYRSETKRLCTAAKELGIPLEINLLGVHDGRHYPNEIFWQIAAEVGCSAIFGLDAHTAERAYDANSIEKAKIFVKKFNLKLIDEVEITSL